MKLPLRLLFLTCLLAVSASAQTLLQYTITGGAITGSLNGTSFTNASWSATAIADPSTRYFASGGPEDPSYWYIDAPLALTITDSSHTFSVNLTGGTFFSANYSVYNDGDPLGASGYGTFEGASIYVSDANGFIGFNTPTVVSGSSGFDNNNVSSPYATSGGDLVVTGDSGGPGTFTVSTVTPVPEPSTWAVIAGTAALGLAFYRRTRRQRV